MINRFRSYSIKPRGYKRRLFLKASLFVLFVFSLGYGIYYFLPHESNYDKPPIKKLLHLQNTEKNYGKEVDKLAKKFDLPSSYLKALIVLECSGRTEFTPRFEQHVYKKLKKVKDKKRKRYGSITYKELKNKSDQDLKNLASSWGPFQLMGYLSLELNVPVKQLRGNDKGLYWGIFWINKRYGDYLRKGNFKDAFHIHNTGKPYPLLGKPRTYHPDYVKNGLSYYHYFESQKK